MSYLADDAAMRSHFDGQGFLVTRDEVPVQEREADDSYDRLVQAIRVRSFDALLELAREGLTARDVQNAEHDAGVISRLDSELKILVDLVERAERQAGVPLRLDGDQIKINPASFKLDAVGLNTGRIEGQRDCVEGSAI